MTTSNNASNVSSGKPMTGGAAWAAKFDGAATVPVNALTPLGSAFECLGYASEDGLTNIITREHTELLAWGGEVVSNLQTKYVEQYKIKLIEQRAESFKQVFGADNVKVSEKGEISVAHNANTLGRYVYVFEILLDDNRVERLVIPCGEVIEIGEIVRKGGEPIGYEITIQAYADDKGNTSYSYVATIAAPTA